MEELRRGPGLAPAAARGDGRDESQDDENAGDSAHVRRLAPAVRLTPMRRALAIAFVAAALAPAADGAQPTGFAFGRTGGNIRPFTVTIDTDGHEHASGPVYVGRTK